MIPILPFRSAKFPTVEFSFSGFRDIPLDPYFRAEVIAKRLDGKVFVLPLSILRSDAQEAANTGVKAVCNLVEAKILACLCDIEGYLAVLDSVEGKF